MDQYKFHTTPLAETASMVIGAHYRFTLINDKILRYEWAEDGVFEDRASTLAIHRRFPRPVFATRDTPESLEIITAGYHLHYDKKPFSASGFHITFGNKMTLWGSEWRYGNQPDGNLGGTARTLDECNGRCDMGTGILSRAGYSALDDSNTMLFDGRGFVAPRRPGQRVDGYIFSYGLDFKGAMKAYYALSGHQPRLPRWSLGNWWSRYHKYTAESYVELMDKFAEHKIPLSVAVIDMDWHLVNEPNIPHSGWTGYTWDRSLFPDPAAFGKALHDRNLRITLNDHPHSGVHHHEDQYEDMALALDHDTSEKRPILFDPTDPRFFSAWFSILHRSVERQACDFWWIDWQQGPISRIPGLDPLWLLNHFQYLDTARVKPEDLSLVFSRYAGPGSHRYPVGFSGDSIATWQSLQFQPEFTATASNIGYGWWSHDIGGHMHGYRDDELTTRWIQLGVFSPIFRLHSSNSRWASKEPWLYRDEFSTAMHVAMQLRHRLLPYIYSMNVLSASTDEPLVQPMYWSNPNRDEAYEHPNQYFFGSSLMIAPIVQKRDKRTNRASETVWFPPSRWVDIFTGFVYDGDRTMELYRTIHTVPTLAPEGAIIPFDQSFSPANGCLNPEGFEVFVVIGQDGKFTIVESLRDDGQMSTERGGDRAIPITYEQATGQLKIAGAGRQWTFRFISLLYVPSRMRVLIDGFELVDAISSVDTTGPPGLVVKLPSLPKECSITIDLGPDPQLSVLDHTQAISDMILDCQIDFKDKQGIWGVVTAKQPVAVKVGHLLSLGLEKEVVGPILELMLADSRPPREEATQQLYIR